MGFQGRGKPQKSYHKGGGHRQKNPGGNKNNPGKNGRKQENQKKTTVKYIVPAETLKALPGDPWKNVDNLSLKLDRFAPYEWKEGDDEVTIKVSGNVLKNKVGEEGLKIPKNAIQAYQNFFGLYKDGLYKDMVNSLGAITFRLKTATRLVVGLGDESVYETSVRLLRNYGLPYIPGTALKGIARAYALEKFADENLDRLNGKFKTNDFYEIVGRLDKALSEGKDQGIKAKFGKDEENKLEVSFKELIEIFGTTEKSGKVVFFDALPTVEPENEEENDNQKKPSNNNLNDPLEFDIMNPHYGPYYQKGEAPGDWHDPVPVIFLVVKPGVEFLFGVAPLGNRELAGKARAILKEALKEHGVGAKTSLGYGRFQ